jgi:hypothetical protein
MDIPGGSPIYILPKDPPKCPIHKGHMKLNFPADRYDCLGYDGEGCEYHVRLEDYVVEIGTTGEIEFEI